MPAGTVQFHHLPVCGGEHFHPGLILFQAGTNGLDDLVDVSIRPAGVMMCESHPSHTGHQADFSDVFHRAVAPAFLAGVLGIGELRVMDHQVRTCQKLTMQTVILMQRRGLPWSAEVRLVIAGIHHACVLRLQTIAKCQGRMVQKARADAGVINRKAAFGQIVKADARAQLIERDREIGVLHLTGEGFPEGLAETGRAVDVPVATTSEQRRKKGETLNVIPVRVADQDAAPQRSRGARHEVLAEIMRPAATIEDHDGSVRRGDLHA